MTLNLIHLLPAAICGLGGLVCAKDASLSLRLQSEGEFVINSGGAVVCWIAAAISLWGAVS